MKINLLFTFAFALALPACDTTSTDGASSSSSSTSGGGAGACGVIDPPTGASDLCGTCLNQKCCDQGKACSPDATCKSCVARGADSLGDSTCRANALYDAVHQCVNGPCADACGGGGSSGSSNGSSGSCNTTSCNDGPAGDALCKSKGCGACSFGSCLVF